MKLIALMLVRNEDWILGFTARVAMEWCNSVIFYLHNCTDGTLSIIEQLEKEHPDRVSYISNNSDSWNEMDMRQTLLEQGRLQGGTHFAMIDADEAITADMLSSIRNMSERVQPTETLELPMRPPWKGLTRYRNDKSVWCRSWMSTVFCDHPSLSWKPNKLGYHHHHRLPYGVEKRIHPIGHKDLGGNMHLQWTNWARVTQKHCWYKMHEAIVYPDKPIKTIDTMYSEAVIDENPTTSECPEAWFYGYEKWIGKIDLSSKQSWYNDECEAMLAVYGKEKFKGLNLFGVV